MLWIFVKMNCFDVDRNMCVCVCFVSNYCSEYWEDGILMVQFSLINNLMGRCLKETGFDSRIEQSFWIVFVGECFPILWSTCSQEADDFFWVTLLCGRAFWAITLNGIRQQFCKEKRLRKKINFRFIHSFYFDEINMECHISLMGHM